MKPLLKLKKNRTFTDKEFTLKSYFAGKITKEQASDPEFVKTFKKRLRKKYRIGEFKQTCLPLIILTKPKADLLQNDKFIGEFIEFIELIGLLCMANWSDKVNVVYIYPNDYKYKTLSDEQIKLITNFIEPRIDKETTFFKMYPPLDLNYEEHTAIENFCDPQIMEELTNNTTNLEEFYYKYAIEADLNKI
ncbi:MAG: hypothetical protein [Bacteriophage sp.]|nr:MAG: hypothetical protein [Bacteriophage sp.]